MPNAIQTQSAETCATCPAFNPMPDENGEAGEGGIGKGECRMRPPEAHLLVIPAASVGRVVGAGSGPAVMAQTVFPVVMSDAWCLFHPKHEIGRGLKQAMNSVSGFPVHADT